MYKLLVGLMVVSALGEMKLSLRDISDCYSQRHCILLEKKSREYLRLNWMPISMFPEQAKRFK